jgi:Derlin-2/3
MNEFKIFYFQLPPITRYYLSAIFATATIATYIKPLQMLIYYIFLDYDLVFRNFQFWRLFTNVFFIGGFSSSFLFFVVMVYLNLKSAEQNAIVLKAYAAFIMMLVYLLVFLNIINLLSLKIFGFKPGFTLAQQLFLSLIYISSKREPQKIVTLYFFRMKNAFFPYALIVLNIVSGGGIYDNIIGIIVGNIYFVLKDVLPESKGLNILKTPKFLVDLVEKYYYARLPRDEPNNNDGNNNNNGGGEFGFGNSGVMNRGARAGGNNNNTNRGFRAFGGRGYTVG